MTDDGAWGAPPMSPGEEPVDLLVVDDHPENVLALEGMLARPDYRIVSCHSGAEALRHLLRREFALILLDVVMPTMDGLQTAALVRQRESSRHTPIIFLTATAGDVGLLYRAYSVGAVDYLVKPLLPEVVRAKVSVFVDLHRKSRQVKRHQEELRAVERRRSEAALRDSEAQYEATFDEAPVGIAHASRDGRWLRVNRRFCDIVGHTRAELLGMGWADLTDASDRRGDLFPALCASRNLSGHPTPEERRWRRKGGGVVWVRLQCSPLRGAPDSRFILVVEDVTERRRAEERQRFLGAASEILLRSLEPRQALSNLAGVAVAHVARWCIFAPNGGGEPPVPEPACAHADRALNALLEHLRDRGDREPALRSVLRPERPALWPLVSREVMDDWAVGEETRALLDEIGCHSLMGVPVVVRGERLATLVMGVDGGAPPYGVADLTMLSDLAHRVAFALDNARLFREAQEAVRAREDFLSIASHELRTPLTPLQLFFQRVRGERGADLLASPQRLEPILERSERQVQRLTALVDTLLDVSRLSSGRLQLEVAECDLAELARDVAGRFSEEAARTGCTIGVLAPEPVIGCWDRFRLEQVVTNLLSNALKYGGGKPVDVSVSCRADRALLVVRDQGIGIDPDKLPRIFERFERAVSVRSYGGLGLGLYITRQLVDAHGGVIDVESASGVGSTFTVELPLSLKRSAPRQLEVERAGASVH